MYVRIVVDKQPKNYSSPAELQRRLEAVLELAAQRTITKLKIYPSRSAPSGYRRTGRLRDEWRYFRSRAGGDIAFQLQNDARVRYPKVGHLYASYVQGRKQPFARGDMRAIGWITADELLDRERIAKDVQNEITAFLRGR
jgi:hypothetical protein